jgi:hypothetical protein
LSSLMETFFCDLLEKNDTIRGAAVPPALAD